MWPFKKRSDEELIIENIYSLYIEFDRIFEIRKLFPALPRESSKDFKEWRLLLEEDKQKILQLKKVIINLNLIENFFVNPFKKIRRKGVIRNNLPILAGETEEERNRILHNFIIELDNNNIILIFVSFLELQKEISEFIKLLPNNFDVRNANLALKELPKLISSFGNAMNFYLKKDAELTHAQTIKRLDEDSGKIKRRAA